MQEKVGSHMPINSKIEQVAAQRARERAKNGRWDLDVAVFLFGLIILILILLFQGENYNIAASIIAALGLTAVWVGGYRKEKRLYELFYDEELSRLQNAGKALEETIEDRVQKALRERR
jgi:hypothetical protein